MLRLQNKFKTWDRIVRKESLRKTMSCSVRSLVELKSRNPSAYDPDVNEMLVVEINGDRRFVDRLIISTVETLIKHVLNLV